MRQYLPVRGGQQVDAVQVGMLVAAGRALVDGMADKQIGQWHGALPDGIFLEKILNPAKSTNKIHGF